MPTDVQKTTLLIHLSPGFKEAIGVYATAHNMPVSELIRGAVADVIGYDITIEHKAQGRPRKYKNQEEKKKAQNTVRQLMAQIMHEQHLKDVHALEAYLERREKINGN